MGIGDIDAEMHAGRVTTSIMTSPFASVVREHGAVSAAAMVAADAELLEHDLVDAVLEILDPVAPVQRARALEDEPVGAGVSPKLVAAEFAEDLVDAGAAMDLVAAVAAQDQVIARCRRR